ILKVHPAAEMFPMLAPDELKELADNIAKNGLYTPIVFFKEGKQLQRRGRYVEPHFCDDDVFLLDGRNRLSALELNGGNIFEEYPVQGGGTALALDAPITFMYGESRNGESLFRDQTDPFEFVVSANLHRRHLTDEQKRELIAALLKAKPERSDVETAYLAKVS